MTTGVITGGGPPKKCFRADADGTLPVCTKMEGGDWEVSYPDATMGAGMPSGFGVLFVLVLIAGVLGTVWKVTTARRMARDAGLSEGDATTMALLTDDGFESTYLASSLRQPPAGPTAAEPPSPPVPREAAERLRELDELRAQGLIDEEEYAATRQAILGSL